jgi:hypothetical protein
MSRFRKQHELLVNQINTYNSELPTEIITAFQQRKQEIISRRGIITDLGLSLRTRSDLPQTLRPSILRPRKGLHLSRLTSRSTITNTFSINIDEAVYHNVLQTIHDMGIMFERLPSLYKRKSEEEIRDLILFQLTVRFEIVATGESFNKSGKTDIFFTL